MGVKKLGEVSSEAILARMLYEQACLRLIRLINQIENLVTKDGPMRGYRIPFDIKTCFPLNRIQITQIGQFGKISINLFLCLQNISTAQLLF